MATSKNWYYEHGCPQTQQLRNKAWRAKNRERYNESCRQRRLNNPAIQFRTNKYQTIRRILNGVQVKTASLQKYRITNDDIQRVYDLQQKNKVC